MFAMLNFSSADVVLRFINLIKVVESGISQTDDLEIKHEFFLKVIKGIRF